MGHEARGEDCGLRAILSEAKVSDEVAAALENAGVFHFDQLITLISRGDHHEELKRVGVGKLGVRAKLATLVQPYWKALTAKEQGNAKYKDGRYEEAAQHYTNAVELIPGVGASSDIAINCYSNRAACFQQMREPHAALTDVKLVLAFDPTNAKAQARRAVYEQALNGM